MTPTAAIALRASLLVAVMGAAGCIISRSVHPVAMTTAVSDSATVRTPVKAHLTDGGTVVFISGATVARSEVVGRGWRYDVTLAESTAVTRLPLDSIIAMETFVQQINPGRTILYSALATGGVILGGIALACAVDPKCFGSCPTVYADSAGTPVLEAEGFSGSISPLLEARDVDRLRVGADLYDTLRLEVWNEALETHYINHLELLEVTHSVDEMVLPDERGRPLAVAGLVPASAVTDRAGRSLSRTLASTDGDVFSSDPALLARATATDLYDHIDVSVPVRPGADSAALVLRLRSSLLNTLVFYDFMLARPGARALDWLADDLARLDRVAELGRWYGEYFGIRVAVWDGASYRQVARFSDYGPIAWRDAALVVPAPTGDTLRLRLSFLTDQWRIDRLAVAARVRRAEARTIPVGVVTAAGRADTTATSAVREADEHYLRTNPRQRFSVAFDVGARTGPGPTGRSSRTFLLASQGYYTEWMRGAWLTGARDTTTFTPSVETLVEAMRSWSAQRDSMERQFFRSRIPVY